MFIIFKFVFSVKLNTYLLIENFRRWTYLIFIKTYIDIYNGLLFGSVDIWSDNGLVPSRKAIT